MFEMVALIFDWYRGKGILIEAIGGLDLISNGLSLPDLYRPILNIKIAKS